MIEVDYSAGYRTYRVNGKFLSILGIDNGKMLYRDMNGFHKAVINFRAPKTWNEYLGNKPAGLYFTARFTDGSKNRVYLCELHEFK